MQIKVEVDPLTLYLLSKYKAEAHRARKFCYEQALMFLDCFFYYRPLGVSLEAMSQACKPPPGIIIDEFKERVPIVDMEVSGGRGIDRYEDSLVAAFYTPPKFDTNIVTPIYYLPNGATL